MNGLDNVADVWTDEQSMDKLGHWNTLRTIDEWTLLDI